MTNTPTPGSYLSSSERMFQMFQDQMVFLFVLGILTAAAAGLQDLSGKMFTFPEETATANVRLITTTVDFTAVTVCLRSFTDLRRSHTLFSLATPSSDNGFVVYKSATSDVIDLDIDNKMAQFRGQEYKQNVWHSVCSTWDSEFGLSQFWLDGKPSVMKYIGGQNIREPFIVLGQEQDSQGGGFDIEQSFTGMIADVHMWDYVLTRCEIQQYTNDLNFTPGNALNWKALEFQTTGRVLLEEKLMICL
ncbi:serum amyloid P-component-like [Aulostomus maculatus]